MTAVAEACLLTDIIQIVIGKAKKFFCLEDPYSLDIFLTAHTVKLTEFRRKARIAHSAHDRKLRNSYIVLNMLVDIFCDCIDIIFILIVKAFSSDDKSPVKPVSYYVHHKIIDVHIQYKIISVILCFHFIYA